MRVRFRRVVYLVAVFGILLPLAIIYQFSLFTSNTNGNVQQDKVTAPKRVRFEKGVEGRGEEKGNKASPGVDGFTVYDWEKDIQPSYFRAKGLSDDMLGLRRPVFASNFKNPCFYVVGREGEQGGVSIGTHHDVQLKCLPFFHLIGVDKAGTTDLWFRMTQHKHVLQNSGVLGKETHWWSWRRFGFDIWVRNALIRHFDWYISHFDAPAKKMMNITYIRGRHTYHPAITGEGSPTVFWDFTGWNMIPQNLGKTPDTAQVTPHCINHVTPNAKFLLLLRNPVNRLYSEYLFLDRFKSKHNVSPHLFHEGVKRSIAMYQACVQKQATPTACLYNKTLHMDIPVRIMVGMYSVWLKQWLAVFPANQILILRNEDYAADMSSNLRRVFDFLEVEPLSTEEMTRVVKTKRAFQRSEAEKAVGDMLPETRQILTNYYKDYNKQLADMLQDQKYLWS